MKAYKLLLTTIILLLSMYAFPQFFSNRLDNEETFVKFSGLPLANKYGNVKAVKVVYDIKSEKIYFLNAKKYKNHFEFCKQELNYLSGYGNFLKYNYANGGKREFLLGNINYFQSLNKYVIEISPTDLMTDKQIVTICKEIQENSFIEEQYFFIATPRLRAINNKLKQYVLTISPKEIYRNLSYQAVSKYENKGILKFVDDIEAYENKIEVTDILVLNKIPNFLPPVAGVIVTEFQTPLSHISILGLNRKIPICAYKQAFKSEKLLQFNEQQVSFTVKTDTFYIAIDKTPLQTKTKNKIQINQNLDVDSIISIKFLNAKSSSYVGSKAANFAELYHISKNANFKTPECAFAIPFYFYNQHIIDAKVKKLIEKLPTIHDNETRNEYLTKIRAKINKTKIDKALLNEVNRRLAESADYENFRFRSSTNAEDIEGFSGAGLYKSKTGKLNSKIKSIEKAIKTVWASNWSEKAYYEREYYSIDQNNVAMGILVHRSFPREKVNGVAITKNIYRKNSNAFLVNAQLGNENVVNPSPGIICDQFLCFPQKSNKIYDNKIVIDVITYSSLNGNKLVMYEDEIQNLANQLDIIKRHFTGELDKWHYTRIGYDVEFKISGNDRKLYIKQVRPYND